MKLNNGKKKIKRKDLKYETTKSIYDFKQQEIIRYFGDIVYTRQINVAQARDDQIDLLNDIEFNDSSRARSKEGKDKKNKYLWKCICSLWRWTPNASKSGTKTFSIKINKC